MKNRSTISKILLVLAVVLLITQISVNIATIWVEETWFNTLSDHIVRWGWLLVVGCAIASERLKKHGQEK